MHNVSNHSITSTITQNSGAAASFYAVGFDVPGNPRACRPLAGNGSPVAQLENILGRRLRPILFPLPDQWHWSIYEDPAGKCKHFGYFVEVAVN